MGDDTVLSRRCALRAIACSALWSNSLAADAEHPSVTVVWNSATEAFGAAMEGIRTQIGAAANLKTVEVQDPGVNSVPSGTQAILALGVDALKKVAGWAPQIPVVGTMTMRADAAQFTSSIANLGLACLDVDPAALLAETGAVLKISRLGIVRNPARGGAYETSLANRAKQMGWKTVVADCDDPARLLPEFISMKSKVDAVLTVPDSTLYNGATVKPLILASLEQRLPIIGFSSSFVRAGAAMGVYPDFRELGSQAAEVLKKSIAGHGAKIDENARKLIVATNQRVGRLMGLEFYSRPQGAEVITFR